MRARAKVGTVSAGALAWVVAALLVLALAPLAHAAPITDEEELTQFGSKGAAAGQLSTPDGLATDPVTGHVYVADGGDRRVDEFTAWGEFVKAFGWDVAPGAVNEVQEVRLRASSGAFKLSFGASTTPDLPFGATAGELESALNALSSIGGSGASVTSSPGTPDGLIPYTYVIAFQGSLAATDVAQLAAVDQGLAGGNPSTFLEARTRADGHPATAGLESCTAESGCREGLQGGGVGQLTSTNNTDIAVSAAGDVYVHEPEGSHRVQELDPAGRFVRTWGKEVNKTAVEESATRSAEEDLCPAPGHPADICQAGAPGAGPGEFGENNSRGIVFDPAGRLFVADTERIQRFSAAGEFEASIPVAGTTVHHLALAPNSDFYVTVGPPSGTEQGVRVLDASTGTEKGQLEGTELDEVPATKKTAGPLATYPAGDVFATRNNVSPSPVLQFDSSNDQISEFGVGESGFRIEAIGTNTIGTAYVAYRDTSSSGGGATYIRAFGPGPAALEAPPHRAPTIAAQFATSVARTDATLRARINPHFWPDTRYYVQYGTGKCSEGGCESEQPLPPGALLSHRISGSALKSAPVFLEGLEPGTTYHYRFAAQSTGGGPAYGVDPDGEGPKQASAAEGGEATFTTYPVPAPAKSDCPNQALRGGLSASLPDCRADEMVSPPDKNNGDVKTLFNITGYRAGLDQSAAGGERFTYSSYRAFADPASAPYTNQYLASRGEDGWSNVAIDPPLEAAGVVNDENAVRTESPFKAFSADLCQGWLLAAPEPALGPGAIAEYPDLYRRDNCGGEGYEALLQAGQAQPSGEASPDDYQSLEMQGASADGEETVFRLRDKLTPEATGGGLWQAYYASGGGLRALCVLPSGEPAAANCSAGTGGQAADANRKADVSGAVSADGSRVYWTVSGVGQLNVSGPGAVYLRENPAAPESAHLHGVAVGSGNLIGPATSPGHINATKTITAVTNAAAFSVGQEISGEGIQAATTVTAVEKEVLKISKAATLTATVQLTGLASPIVSNVSVSVGAFAAGQRIFAEGGGIALGTTIVSCSPSCGPTATSLTLSAPATRTGTEVGLEATSPCTEAARACTLPVSGGEQARFLDANPEGTRALFELTAGPGAGDLYEFDAQSESATLIAKEVGQKGSGEPFAGLVGASEDLSYVYLASWEASPQAEGEGAIAGRPNLYLSHEGSLSFIATFSSLDVTNTELPSDTSPEPIFHAARVSPDGRTLAFISTEPLTGYDNADQASEAADSEVYLYQAGAPGPVCVSCNPSGARPAGGRVKILHDGLPAAATIPPAQLISHFPRTLSADGRRLFFDSFDALLPRDTNGAEDVYEWEAASGPGECEEEGADLYVEASGGCLSLISSGQSPQDSEFLDASESGSDVFFTTNASLLPRDFGLIDVYDARVEGGFPEPSSTAACEGEACQGTPEPPNDSTPSSSSFEGAGNVHEEVATRAPRPCAKGKVKRHGKCVAKKHQAKKHKRAKRRRGGAR